MSRILEAVQLGALAGLATAAVYLALAAVQAIAEALEAG